jgi:hypothetical protein
MAKVSRAEERRRRRNYVVATVVGLVAAAAFSGAAYFMASQPGELDARMCPAKGPVGHTVVLIDTTDPFTFTQRQAFSVLFKDLVRQQTPEGYLLSVFVLGERFEENAKAVVELCNPGSGAGKNQFTTTLEKLRRTYEEGFLQPLEAQAEKLARSEPAKFSPILEMLQLASINGFRKEAIKGEHRLVLVSDMLHNTPQFSMYKPVPEYAAFAASAYGQKTQLRLDNVKVDLHYLMNSPALQTRRNLQFWEEHFTKAGARIVAVRPLEG